jgi:hypothetical protein
MGMAGKLMHAIQYDSYDGGPAALKVFFFFSTLYFFSLLLLLLLFFFLISLLISFLCVHGLFIFTF